MSKIDFFLNCDLIPNNFCNLSMCCRSDCHRLSDKLSDLNQSKAELCPCDEFYYTASLSKVGSATSPTWCERTPPLKPLSIHGSRTLVVVIRENLLRYKKFFSAIQAWCPPPLPLRLSLGVDTWQIDEWTNYPTSSTQDRRHSGPSEIKTYLIPFCQLFTASKSSGRSFQKALGTNMAAHLFQCGCSPNADTEKVLDFYKMKPHRAWSTYHHHLELPWCIRTKQPKGAKTQQ